MRAFVLGVACLLAACGGGTTAKTDGAPGGGDAAHTIDAPPGTPDAPPAMIDAPPGAPDAAMACASPGAPGNDMGVGKYCTAGGGQCSGLAAFFCTADFGQMPSFCTKPCSMSSQCGTDATCSGDPSMPDGGSQMGCVPNCLLGMP